MSTPHTFTLAPADVAHFRTMLREQLAGDHELRRDVLDGREHDRSLDDVNARIALVERLAERVGGLY